MSTSPTTTITAILTPIPTSFLSPAPLFSLHKSPGGRDVVHGRDLHEFLEVGTEFPRWMQRRIEEYDFQLNRDFSSFLAQSTGGRPRQEYLLTLDMAKQLAMVEGNEKGKQARLFFIQAEKALRKVIANTPAPPTNYAEALRQLAAKVESEEQLKQQLVLEVEKKHQARQESHRLLQVASQVEQQLSLATVTLEAQAPAVELMEFLTTAKDTLTLEEAAKMLGIGRTTLVNKMERHGLLTKSTRLPYQRYIDAGQLVVKYSEHKDARGKVHQKTKILVTSVKGMALLKRLFCF